MCVPGILYIHRCRIPKRSTSDAHNSSACVHDYRHYLVDSFLFRSFTAIKNDTKLILAPKFRMYGMFRYSAYQNVATKHTILKISGVAVKLPHRQEHSHFHFMFFASLIPSCHSPIYFGLCSTSIRFLVMYTNNQNM